MGGKLSGGNRVSRDAAVAAATPVVDALEFACDYRELVGSIRRGRPVVGDADLLVTILDRALFEKVMHEKFKVTIKGEVGGRASFVVQTEKEGPLQVDVFVCDKQCLATHRLMWSGPASWNMWCRSRAKKLGLKLNEYGLWSKDAEGARDEKNRIRTPLLDEETVLSVLGIEYVHPTERDDRNKWKLI